MKMMRRSICLVLAAIVAFGCFIPVFAEEETPETVKIVSLGDSNMNGYGLAEFWENPEYSSCYAFNRRVPGSYPDMLVKGLEANGYDVELSQLATSAFRAYDLRLILDPSLSTDGYFDMMIGNVGWLDKIMQGTPYANQAKSMTTDEKRAVLHDLFREEIEDADVITVGLGANEMTMLSLAVSGRDLAAEGFYYPPESEFGRLYTEAENRFLAAVSRLLAGTGSAEQLNMSSETIKNVLKVFRTGYVGLTWNADAVLRQIVQWNPDAEIVWVPCSGIVPEHFSILTEDGKKVPIGKLNEILFSLVNEYRVTLSPYADKIVFADTVDRYPTEIQLDELYGTAPLTSLSADTTRSVFEIFRVLRTVLTSQDYSGLPETLQRETAANLLKLNAITSITSRGQSGRTFGLIRETYQRGVVSFELAQQRIMLLPTVTLEPQLAADIAAYLVTGVLSGGDDDTGRMNRVQGYINCFLLYGDDSSGMHLTAAGNAAQAEAVIYALENDMNAREYVWTERREATKEFAKEAAETTREVMKEAAEKTEEIVKEVGKAAIGKAAEVREAVRERAAEVRTNLREAVKSFLTRGR